MGILEIYMFISIVVCIMLVITSMVGLNNYYNRMSESDKDHYPIDVVMISIFWILILMWLIWDAFCN
jgi:uncharacterized membrane protein YidH (DUF202 family)